jgi:hypothetical protein
MSERSSPLDALTETLGPEIVSVLKAAFMLRATAGEYLKEPEELHDFLFQCLNDFDDAVAKMGER